MIKRARRFLDGPGLGSLLVKAVVGSAGLRIAGMAFGFLVGIQLARGLGVEGYGIYGIAMAAVSILGVPTEFGLPQLLTREVAAAHLDADHARVFATRRWAVRIVIVTSLLVACGVVLWLLLSGNVLHPGLGSALLTGAVLIPLVAFEKLNGATLRGLQQLVMGQLPDTLIRPVAFSALLAIFSLTSFQWSAGSAMALGVASVAIAFLASSWMLTRVLLAEPASIAITIDRKRLWQAALPMALTEGMRTVQGQMSVLLLGFMATASVVGLYRVAASIATFIAMPISLFNIVGGPVIAKLHAAGQRVKLQKLLGWLSLGMLFGTVVVSMPFLLMGKQLLSVIFGHEFSGASGMLQVLCLGVIANGIFGANATLLNMSGHEARVTRASLISLLVLALVLPGAVIVFDGMGAAWSVTLALTLWNGLLWRDARRFMNLETTFISLMTRKVHHA